MSEEQEKQFSESQAIGKTQNQIILWKLSWRYSSQAKIVLQVTIKIMFSLTSSSAFWKPPSKLDYQGIGTLKEDECTFTSNVYKANVPS